MSLRENTKERHSFIENIEFNKRLLNGELSVYEYTLYLHQFQHIFEILETRLVLPQNLLRVDKIKEDINELKVENETYKVLPSTLNYGNLLTNQKIGELMPHVYLNYMAFMFGGQIIKKKIHGSGRIYDFDDIKELITFIRIQQQDEWSDEVNNGYDFLIKIYDELQKSIR